MSVKDTNEFPGQMEKHYETSPFNFTLAKLKFVNGSGWAFHLLKNFM